MWTGFWYGNCYLLFYIWIANMQAGFKTSQHACGNPPLSSQGKNQGGGGRQMGFANKATFAEPGSPARNVTCASWIVFSLVFFCRSPTSSRLKVYSGQASYNNELVGVDSRPSCRLNVSQGSSECAPPRELGGGLCNSAGSSHPGLREAGFLRKRFGVACA